MPQRPKWLGGFVGGNLGSLNYEVFTVQNLPYKEIKLEKELMSVKWFDYRQLAHLQATYYFVKCYTEAYRAFVRRALDSERAAYYQPFGTADILKSKDLKTVTRLRQMVDGLGMRYDFFMTFAMNKQHRMMGEGKIYAPRPGHILNNEELIASAVLAWEEQCEVAMQFAKDPMYRVENFGNTAANAYQLEHEAFVIAQIDKRRHKHYALSAALYRYGVIRVEEAIRHFGAGLVSEAIREYGLA